MRKTLLSCVAGALVLCNATATLAAEDSQLWVGGTANVKLADKWRLSQEVTTKFSDNRSGLYDIESHTLLGYKLSKNVTIWAGYTHNPQYDGGDFRVLERRAREQVTFDNLAQFGKAKLSARMRLEQRWRQNSDGTGWRARPYAKLSIPVTGKTSLVASHESFVNLNTTSFQRTEGYDRMRNLVGISVPLSKTFGLEAGYLNQHGFVRKGPDTTDHVASFSLSANF
jgi:hypothetical protein